MKRRQIVSSRWSGLLFGQRQGFCFLFCQRQQRLDLQCRRICKNLKGYDGRAMFKLLPDSLYTSQGDADPVDTKLELPGVLKEFLHTPQLDNSATAPNPAAIPCSGTCKATLCRKAALATKEKFDLIMIGNSITHNFEKPEYQPIWNRFFAPRKALNLGTSAY